ncbi:regulator of nucleoside diphosphate kinase [Mesorhizobium sp. J18]|uniref:nucleoside-diphosphate kinase n=1 Tax=Mesorhizobium sp. J18 TaxID=935263 RepID=UPI001199C7D2|nr:nucleoside-diphosphate kinase [Mesorhizobium sp. J18]TWH00103.1 regulator of nucleoside diphosphate kinase [Mesorhizobium sp. J18]
MSETACILTTKDFTILEVMLDRCRDTALAALLRQKLDKAQVVFREDIPEHTATLNSRLIYRMNDGPANTRIISHALIGSPVGLFLPITNPRGLALLGLSEGQVFELAIPEGRVERILLEKVLYQPEAERRRKNHAIPGGTRPKGRPMLSLVHSSDGVPTVGASVAPIGDPEDPGPSAA